MALSHKFLADRYARQIWEDSQPEDGEFWYGQATALKLDIQARVGAENYRDWYWSQFPTDPPTSRALFKAIIQQYRTELLSQVANV